MSAIYCQHCGRVQRSEAAQRSYRLNTLSDIIAYSSPSGRCSKRTRKAVDENIKERLFGRESGCIGNCAPSSAQVRASKIDSLRSRIQTLETCCRIQLSTGRQNKTTRSLAEARAQLEALECAS